MKVIVFSKDRPLQLHACLASLIATCREVVEIEVLYFTTSERMADRYAVLAKEMSWAKFVPEVGFGKTFLGMCANTEHLCFVTDDVLFIRLWSAEYAIHALGKTPGALGVSLRLGTNCTHSYVKGDVPQKLPALFRGGSWAPWQAYCWPGADKDFDYPLEVSASIYRTADIFPLINHGGYSNPNQLELVLSAASSNFKKSKPILLCPEKSVAFANQLNVVQDVFPSRCSYDSNHSVSALAEAFDNGDRVDVHALMGYTPRAVHEVAPFTLRKP